MKRMICLAWAILLLFTGVSMAQGKVTVAHGALRLPTYPWLEDRNPVFQDYETHIYYPYTRQDHILSSREEREYRCITLENEFLKVTCLPELGGRIHSVLDKTTNEEMFHKNNEIKPALIAMRGAWISGGIEWNAGPQGHTVHIVSPVDVTALENEDGSATLVIGNTEKMFGTRWTVRLTLHPGKAYLDETIRMYNPTDGSHPYYFWNCTAFPNLEGTRFIYPMTLGCDHNGTEFFEWPVYKGKDITYLRNYPAMSSVFAWDCVFDFFGAYDVNRNRGIVSYANHLELKGKKAWTWGKDDFGVVSQMALSDAGPVDAQYIEVQSGPLLTQAEYGMLEPHSGRTWREFWYPVHGLGDGFEYATRDAAVQAMRKDGTLEIKAIATAVFANARCVLSQAGKNLLEQPIDLSPAQSANVVLPQAPEGPIAVTLLDAQGRELLAYETPLAIPEVKTPDLAKKPTRQDGRSTADELYEKAFLLDRQSSRNEARTAYEAVLAEDPLHGPAHCGLATLALESGRFEDAAGHAKKALERDADLGRAWHLLGAAQLNLGQLEDARVSGYKAAHTLDAVALGYTLAGRACLKAGKAEEALQTLKRAMLESPHDSQTRNLFLTARYATGERETLLPDLRQAAEWDDPTDFVPHALWGLVENSDRFAQALNAMGGEKEFVCQKACAFLFELGLKAEAASLMQQAASPAFSALHGYFTAFYWTAAGQEEQSKTILAGINREQHSGVFPAGAESRAMLQWAVKREERDDLAWLWLGELEAGLGNLNEAVAAWRKAVELTPKHSEAWRSLALHAQKKDNNPDEAERCFRSALEAAPDDQLIRFELAALLEQRGKRDEAIALAESVRSEKSVRYDLALWLAETYVKESRFDDCLGLLAQAQFSNWEGQSRPRDIFVSALLGRGKAAFEARDSARALADFELALTYPENLHVGARYAITDAEVRYWQGKALLALGRPDEARNAWQTGAAQPGKSDPALPFITVTDTQDEYKKRCATALDVLAAK